MSIIDEKWEFLFSKYHIAEQIRENGRFFITADQIREAKEPRLMTKFDTRESLPKVFGQDMGILPVTRGTYVLGDFDLYQDFPESSRETVRIQEMKVPDYLETIDCTDIRSEAAAINAAMLSGILEDFLGERELRQTVSGRMGSGSFAFSLYDRKGSKRQRIEVVNSQMELDGGFEGWNSFTVLEAKNVLHSDFLVRQLYYPFRYWDSRIRKQVRPVFLVYSNKIFRLLEYEFTDFECYNSIRLVQEKHYSLENTKITFTDLWELSLSVTPKEEPPGVPFIQADSFEKVISLVEHLAEGPMTGVEIAELFGFRERQSDYYYNACRYLGLAEKTRTEKGAELFLTPVGEGLLQLGYRERQLTYVRLMLEHSIFGELFAEVLRNGEAPERKKVANLLVKKELCSENVALRRASSVCGWFRWILQLVQE